MKSIGLFKILSIFIVIFTIIFGIAISIVLLNAYSAETNTYTITTPALLRFLLIAIIVINILLLVILFRTWTLSAQNKEDALSEQKKQFNMIIENKSTEEEEQEIENIDEKVQVSVEKVISNLDGIDSIEKYSEQLLINISKVFEIVQGMMFVINPEKEEYEMASSYAFYSEREISTFSEGEGISGQVAKNQELIVLDSIPDDYITVVSGLGSSSPKYMCVFPIIHNEMTIAVIEVAAFKEFGRESQMTFRSISKKISEKINTMLS